MKTTVSGTGAAALVTIFAQSAQSAEFEMTVGGYFETRAAYADAEYDNMAPPPDYAGVDVKRDAEIHFKPSLTLDNGIRVGATVELEGSTSGDQIDESYISIDGAFGRLVIGSENSARYLMQYAAPSVGAFGVNSGDAADHIPFTGKVGVFDEGRELVGFTGSGLTVPEDEEEFSTHVFLSLIAGRLPVQGEDESAFDGLPAENLASYLLQPENEDMFQKLTGEPLGEEEFSVSELMPNADPGGAIYGGPEVFRGTLGSTWVENMANNDAERIAWFTPRVEGLQLGLSYARDAGQDSNAQIDVSREAMANIVDVGVNWVRALDGVGVALSGGWGRAFGDADEDPEVWNAGVNLGYGGWTVGGSFAEQNNAGNMDGTAFDAGVSYATGPWSFSFTYFQGESVDNEYNSGADTEIIVFNRRSLVTDFGRISRTVDVDFPGDQQHMGQNGNDERQIMFLAEASYALARGAALNVYGSRLMFEEDTGDDGGAGDNVDGFILGAGIRLNF